MALSQKVSESAGVAFNSSLKDTETTNYPVQISVTSFQFLIKGYEDMRNYAIQLQKAYFQFLIKGYKFFWLGSPAGTNFQFLIKGY